MIIRTSANQITSFIPGKGMYENMGWVPTCYFVYYVIQIIDIGIPNQIKEVCDSIVIVHFIFDIGVFLSFLGIARLS